MDKKEQLFIFAKRLMDAMGATPYQRNIVENLKNNSELWDLWTAEFTADPTAKGQKK